MKKELAKNILLLIWQIIRLVGISAVLVFSVYGLFRYFTGGF